MVHIYNFSQSYLNSLTVVKLQNGEIQIIWTFFRISHSVNGPNKLYKWLAWRNLHYVLQRLRDKSYGELGATTSVKKFRGSVVRDVTSKTKDKLLHLEPPTSKKKVKYIFAHIGNSQPFWL